jgi:hypothetical protein
MPKALGRLTHLDDPERVAFYLELLSARGAPREASFDERRRRLLKMLAWGLMSGATGHASLDAFFDSLWREEAVRVELRELLTQIDERSRTPASPSMVAPEIPLTLTRAVFTPGDRRRARLRRGSEAEGDAGRHPLGSAGEQRRVLH